MNCSGGLNKFSHENLTRQLGRKGPFHKLEQPVGGCQSDPKRLHLASMPHLRQRAQGTQLGMARVCPSGKAHIHSSRLWARHCASALETRWLRGIRDERFTAFKTVVPNPRGNRPQCPQEEGVLSEPEKSLVQIRPGAPKRARAPSKSQGVRGLSDPSAESEPSGRGQAPPAVGPSLGVGSVSQGAEPDRPRGERCP